MRKKQIYSALIAVVLFFSIFFSNVTIEKPLVTMAATTETDITAAAESNNLQEYVQDGVTLQCWNWSYNNISANMETIADQGFSAVQTSPIQICKEATTGRTQGSSWWLYYQPAGFYIDDTGTNALGTKSEFEAMCETAHQYGIKVIVDVVANHLGNSSGNDLSSAITSDIKDDSSCWHDITTNISDYSSRYNITQYCMSGLPDLNTGSSKIQNYVLTYLEECIDAGADGFRFDAAKHIETPDDSSSSCSSQFWPTVIDGATSYASSTRGIDLYCYGEVLDQPDSSGTLSITSYTKYMSVTDNQSSNATRTNVNSGNASGAASSYYYKAAAGADKLVLWAESHDTYADNASSGVSTSNINKTWAIIAARADAMGLYFARPESYNTLLGSADVTGWSYSEVAAINEFHNYFAGTTEYCASSGNIAYVERGTTGVVLVNCSGTSTDVSVNANKIVDGTYTDQITGNTFTVSNGIISGSIGSTGIAVVYNATTDPTVSISQEGGTFSDTLTLTTTLSNAVSGTYQIGSQSAVSYTSSASFTIGEDMNIGDSVIVTLTASSSTETETISYTFSKVDLVTNTAYIKLPDGWSTPVYCYAYDSATETISNAAWPGEQMTLVSDGIYSYEISSEIEDPRVIFYSSSTNRYPGDMEEGLLLSGSMIYEDGSWTTYEENNETTSNIAYLTKPDGWGSTIYCYVYSEDDESNQNAAWPGEQMTLVSGTTYKYTVSDSITNPLVIFTDGTNQYPAAYQKGLSLTGSMIYTNGSWSTYSE